jgi:glycosyltransferase involved in cell wall biosynthesis
LEELRHCRVTIDGSGLQAGPGQYSGIARTTRELVAALLGEALPFELTVFSQRLRGHGLRELGFSCKTTHLRLPRSPWAAWLTKATGLVEAVCDCDLFHAPSNYAPVKRLDRLIVTIHDAMFLSYPEEHLRHSLERQRIPPVARGARAILTPSECSKRDIVRYMGVDPLKVHVTPWGVRHEHFQPAEDVDRVRSCLKARFGLREPFFLCVSCDIGRKNSARVLQQYLRLAQQSPDNGLVMVWRRPPGSILEQVQHNGRGNRVRLLESVTDEELRDLYCAATATLFPSLYEGFGLPVLESMACGTPVVTARNSSLMEVGDDAVLYVDPLDDDQVYHALERFENDGGFAAALSHKGLLRAAEFTWERCARQTIAVYQSCLAELA